MKAVLLDTKGNIFKTIDLPYPVMPTFYMPVHCPVPEARFWDEEDYDFPVSTIKTLEFYLVDDVDDFIEWGKYEGIGNLIDYNTPLIYKLRSMK